MVARVSRVVPSLGGRLHRIQRIVRGILVQWASRRKRISYDFHSYIGSTRHIPKTFRSAALSTATQPSDQRIVLVNAAMGSFLWKPATLRSRSALNIIRDWLGQLGCGGIFMEGPQKSFFISTRSNLNPFRRLTVIFITHSLLWLGGS